jgi:hypothetical protein
MKSKWLILAIFVILAFSLHFAPPRVYSITGAAQPQLSSNARIEAGIADLKVYVQSQAIAHGINPTLALWIVQHESSFDPTRKGDDGNSRGLWQISSIYHPEVSDACAFDPSCSTQWSLAWIAKGNVMQWSSRRFCRDWYPDCPF